MKLLAIKPSTEFSCVVSIMVPPKQSSKEGNSSGDRFDILDTFGEAGADTEAQQQSLPVTPSPLPLASSQQSSAHTGSLSGTQDTQSQQLLGSAESSISRQGAASSPMRLPQEQNQEESPLTRRARGGGSGSRRGHKSTGSISSTTRGSVKKKGGSGGKGKQRRPRTLYQHLSYDEIQERGHIGEFSISASTKLGSPLSVSRGIEKEPSHVSQLPQFPQQIPQHQPSYQISPEIFSVPQPSSFQQQPQTEYSQQLPLPPLQPPQFPGSGSQSLLHPQEELQFPYGQQQKGVHESMSQAQPGWDQSLNVQQHQQQQPYPQSFGQIPLPAPQQFQGTPMYYQPVHPHQYGTLQLSPQQLQQQQQAPYQYIQYPTDIQPRLVHRTSRRKRPTSKVGGISSSPSKEQSSPSRYVSGGANLGNINEWAPKPKARPSTYSYHVPQLLPSLPLVPAPAPAPLPPPLQPPQQPQQQPQYLPSLPPLTFGQPLGFPVAPPPPGVGSGIGAVSQPQPQDQQPFGGLPRETNLRQDDNQQQEPQQHPVPPPVVAPGTIPTLVQQHSAHEQSGGYIVSGTESAPAIVEAAAPQDRGQVHSLDSPYDTSQQRPAAVETAAASAVPLTQTPLLLSMPISAPAIQAAAAPAMALTPGHLPAATPQAGLPQESLAGAATQIPAAAGLAAEEIMTGQQYQQQSQVYQSYQYGYTYQYPYSYQGAYSYRLYQYQYQQQQQQQQLQQQLQQQQQQQQQPQEQQPEEQQQSPPNPSQPPHQEG